MSRPFFLRFLTSLADKICNSRIRHNITWVSGHQRPQTCAFFLDLGPKTGSSFRMLDIALLLAQTLATCSLAIWMLSGVWDNLKYPHHNEDFTAEVMEMRRLKDGYPGAYEDVKHRAITKRAIQVFVFRLVVFAECLACLLLLLGTAMLVASAFGGVLTDTARGVALLGSAIFTSIWAGMLIVGNYFCYWFAHEGAQLTHFHMCTWGLLTSILIAVGHVG